MQKIYKHIDGTYALFTKLSDGGWVRSCSFTNIEEVLLDNQISPSYTSEQRILNESWTPYDHDNLEWLVEGDVVEDRDRNKRTVLACHGIGESRLYHTSCENFPLKAGGNYTIHELKERNYTRVTSANAPDTKAQEAIEYLESVGRIKAGKIIGE